MKHSKRWSVACFDAALAFCLFTPCAAFAQTSKPPDLTQFSLEDLMNVQVVSVSRKEQPLSKTGAAIFVITQDDIHRSGAANIPDVLRMAPGVNVARIDGNAWAISIRGFNSRYSDKILVLIDGRSIYSPAFSGVYWDQIDVPLEDIERIEVIRGPGGTVWAANAVNGVINIITMSSKSTQGALVVAEVGSQESGSLTQYGGTAGAAGTYRAFGRYSNTDSSINSTNGSAADGWHEFHGGFRADLDLSPQDKLMVQGDVYQSAEGQTLTTVLMKQFLRGDIQRPDYGRQRRSSGTLEPHSYNGSDMSLNVYYNHANRLDQGLVEDSNTFDIDFQHHVALNSRNDVVWGLGYRVTHDRLTSGYDNMWFPPQRTDSLYTAFVQDEIKLAESAWFTVGSKFEHNAYTGFEYEPSAQLVWAQQPGKRSGYRLRKPSVNPPARTRTFNLTRLLFHLSLVILGFCSSRAIRTSRPNNFAIMRWAIALRSPNACLWARPLFAVTIATSRPRSPGLPTSWIRQGRSHYGSFPFNLLGAAHARTYGGEIFATWNVTSRWRLSPGYSLLRMNIIQDPLSESSAAVSGDAPEHQMQIRSSLGLRSNLDWDTSLYSSGGSATNRSPVIPGWIRR